MPFSHGKFTKPGAVKSTGSKAPPASAPREQSHGPAQPAHGSSGEEHVTKTHPGQTQPHPTTGVHAFHGHHTGGGKYKSYTHHDGGEVEEKDHQNAGDMHQAHQEAMPDDGMQDQSSNDGGMDFGNELGGVGGDGNDGY